METCHTLSLSARSGEREGTRRASDGEGEVSFRRTALPALGTHLSPTLSPRTRAERKTVLRGRRMFLSAPRGGEEKI